MRSEPPPAERLLWSRMRNRQLGNFKFRRQQPLCNFIGDFFCAEAKLVVELDGESHSGRHHYDERRTEWLIENGVDVIRVENRDVFENIDGVLEAILRECERRASTTLPPHPRPLPRGERE
jgi:very-short-patch-repair endonuclease